MADTTAKVGITIAADTGGASRNVEELTRKVDTLAAQLTDMGKKSKESGGLLAGMAKGLFVFNQGMAAMTALVEGGKAALEMAKLSAEMKTLRASVPVDALSKMRAETEGTVREVDLLRFAMRAMSGEMALTVDGVELLTGAAHTLAEQGFGEAMTIAQKLENAIRTGEFAGLEKLGIQIDNTKSKQEQLNQAFIEMKIIADTEVFADPMLKQIEQIQAATQDWIHDFKFYLGQAIAESLMGLEKLWDWFSDTERAPRVDLVETYQQTRARLFVEHGRDPDAIEIEKERDRMRDKAEQEIGFRRRNRNLELVEEERQIRSGKIKVQVSSTGEFVWMTREEYRTYLKEIEYGKGLSRGKHKEKPGEGPAYEGGGGSDLYSTYANFLDQQIGFGDGAGFDTSALDEWDTVKGDGGRMAGPFFVPGLSSPSGLDYYGGKEENPYARGASNENWLGEAARAQKRKKQKAANDKFWSETKHEALSSGFSALSAGMAAAVDAAVTGSESIGMAFAKATGAALKSLATESAARALYHTAMGFGALAIGGTLGGLPAAMHFKAAGIFAITAGVAGASAYAIGQGTGQFAAAGGAASAAGGGYTMPSHRDHRDPDRERAPIIINVTGYVGDEHGLARAIDKALTNAETAGAIRASGRSRRAA